MGRPLRSVAPSRRESALLKGNERPWLARTGRPLQFKSGQKALAGLPSQPSLPLPHSLDESSQPAGHGATVTDGETEAGSSLSPKQKGAPGIPGAVHGKESRAPLQMRGSGRQEN